MRAGSEGTAGGVAIARRRGRGATIAHRRGRGSGGVSGAAAIFVGPARLAGMQLRVVALWLRAAASQRDLMPITARAMNASMNASTMKHRTDRRWNESVLLAHRRRRERFAQTIEVSAFARPIGRRQSGRRSCNVQIYSDDLSHDKRVACRVSAVNCYRIALFFVGLRMNRANRNVARLMCRSIDFLGLFDSVRKQNG
ncbi:hypothetical protein [Pseudomonas sp. CGJS7]|uniref:hypothetical protein n=1 Tax=Pseudomonas sp. CGJS7 TaxID=3109348 RepID=UPI00300971B0